MKKTALTLFPALALAALGLWVYDNLTAPMGSFFADGTGWIMALARLAGILGALGVMGQILLMSRAPWLAPLTGGASPVKWHHRAGLAIPLLLLAHPPLVAWHHSLMSGLPFGEQYLAILRWDDVLPAAAGLALIVAAALLSLDLFRRRLPYALWQRLHLGVYLGLALSVGHQLELGGDLSAELPYFAWAWYGLLAFTAANALWFRLLAPRFGAGK